MFLMLSLGNSVSSAGTSQTSSWSEKAGNAKKGNKNNSSKQKPNSQRSPKSGLASVSVESYRIIEDKNVFDSEYLLAVYAAVGEWIELRSFTQDIWHEVVYQNLHSAVAAALSSTAVATVRETCAAVFADFPGRESYDTIVQTVLNHHPNTIPVRFGLGPYQVATYDNTIESDEEDETKLLNTKEQLWVYAYHDLISFVTDFQQNRDGGPSNAMQEQLDNWDPNFDLQQATDAERVNWCRLYTISWLYDLVKVFSSVVIHENSMKGGKYVLEKVDWSKTGPWGQHRRLFGLNEFASDITSLAMQKPDVDSRKKILPHHVFQLQCIVDSFAISRGRSLSPLQDHILESPAQDFSLLREIDALVGRDKSAEAQGINMSISILQKLLERDSELHNDRKRHVGHSQILKALENDLVNCLGASENMRNLRTVPASL